ncbi:MAG: NADH-quinone oxidoreductase subunit J [Pseudomonadota bacterium]|nr:NADH-quinone oxidoreductase subunit J [Pseudomonadota bacterium]MEE3260970.1 NADH-quinone oxidoreductase subunit J [Pseudomonadota bacterium]
MPLTSFLFYLFSFVIFASGTMVIFSKNPVHSVLFLILAFFNSSALFILLGAEFLAMILIIVYVGAVAVLFLFVVMMLDINFTKIREGILQYLPISGLVALILLIELLFVGTTWFYSSDSIEIIAKPFSEFAYSGLTNTKAIGSVLYTDYFYLFQIAAMILLVAMVGAILLTMRQREGVKRQEIGSQVDISLSKSVELKKVPFDRGIDDA